VPPTCHPVFEFLPYSRCFLVRNNQPLPAQEMTMPNQSTRSPRPSAAAGIDWVTLGAAATGIALAATITVASGVTGPGPATAVLPSTQTRAN